ncbi:multidrug ABC transporter [bacterium (Candidatus Blackallbacteria) CG17_big_fil_post_rev_8_21_14_2_50_48_46]|uniref:Multidrug ABC transporter n=1 Tax=bacterium (Candidatus Blackallbacteria) CG17_big_fil_post_rev_8_21_14_2_50_48_46 TaxID=2014261 RepID=A0A2M7G4S7_9BACT|nr:MAG: multidrug ABC transporter [bacterium (Candidatus Blackallbacteria) CG18_big_fil_WC_8_21_14_2_50_49_26]PIW16912.1 MAG: multidrug ABC transporter [bacterium (Candidatus Blackallbacteria) CG17_big_fil_post_rev_8_21_14_2_50_48_46]PIW49330.1 MAG: multidrug ABC transporter [bacterium (Candidatus Blackallbacteria) CG13_big_fil_rev_8_21_14_2_50_49_14]
MKIETVTSTGWRVSLRRFWELIADQRPLILLAFLALLLNSGLNLIAPFLIGYSIDHFILKKNYVGLFQMGGGLFGLYLIALMAHYRQMIWMGTVGQEVLFRLRHRVFAKIQALPVAYFLRHQTGDLISRINNDTDKLNQFLSESLVRFLGNLFIMLGAGVFVLILQPKLGFVALLPAGLLLIWTRAVSPWVKKTNALSLQKTGALSAEIQESLNHFKEIVVFDRRDYFQERFQFHNQENYQAALGAGYASSIFTPVYELVYHLAQLGVLGYGIWLLQKSEITVGLLISFLTYVNRFYDPLRQIAMLWASFQLALASWDRIAGVLDERSELPVLEKQPVQANSACLAFHEVCFSYSEGPEVLHRVSFRLEAGKTYAFVGPTGGGKSTTAALMARLYDPVSGQVFFNGQDLRSLTAEERSQKIGFILQEPFLFEGTVAENLCIGNLELLKLSSAALLKKLEEMGMSPFLKRFEEGLETPVGGDQNQTSLGQKQLLAFMRAVLRRPELLILDEATANIDTVSEKLLEETLQKLPATTTRVVIAHRLNTIESADQIFFVNAGQILPAGSLDAAVRLLMQQERQS